MVPEIDGSFNDQNKAGVRGAWWSTGDLYGADNTPGTGTCPTAGFAPEKCSVLTTPTPGTPFRPTSAGMCTSGIAARVLPGSDGQPAWSAIWGNIIGFTLASVNSPSDGGIDSWGTYDAPAHGITGFEFAIAAVPPEAGLFPSGHLRVSFATRGTETNPAFWRVVVNDHSGSDDASPITGSGPYEILWQDVSGPSYLTNPPPFDPSMLEAIRFDVFSNDQAPVPYSFCINNVALLTD